MISSAEGLVHLTAPLLLLPIIESGLKASGLLGVVGVMLADAVAICFAVGLVVRFVAWAAKNANGSGKPGRQPRNVGRDRADDVPSPRRGRHREDDPLHPLFRRRR